MNEPIKETSCGAVIVNDGKVLLEFQTNGFWSFPKGHIEPGETEVECATRKIREETALDVAIDAEKRYQFGYYIPQLNIDKTVVVFLAHLINPTQADVPVKQDSEIAELRWVPIEEVHQTFGESKPGEDMSEYPNPQRVANWQQAWCEIRQKFGI